MPLGAVLGRPLAPALLVAVLAVGASACHSDGDRRVRVTPGACCAGPTSVASASGQSSPQETAPAPDPPVHTLPRRISPAAPVRRAPNRITGQQPRSSTATGLLDPGVLDPLASARTYVAVRNTYRYDDPTGYAAALTAPAYTTAAFAARSRPTATELGWVRLAQEVSTVRVLTARVDGEAPNTAATRYVDVTFLSSQVYRGDGSGRAQRQVWTLRLLRDHAGWWRVDGVPATS